MFQLTVALFVEMKGMKVLNAFRYEFVVWHFVAQMGYGSHSGNGVVLLIQLNRQVRFEILEWNVHVIC